MDYIEYIKDRIDGKLEIDNYRIIETLIAEAICDENCPLREENENGVCEKNECLEYLKQFFKRYKLVVKVVPKEVDSDEKI